MNKRPKPGDTEDDILQMEKDFLAERKKNPNSRPAATAVTVEKAPKKSLFSRSRENAQTSKESKVLPKKSAVKDDNKANELLGDIQEKNHGARATEENAKIVLGNITEKTFSEPMDIDDIVQARPVTAFPKVETAHLTSSYKGKSIFAQSLEDKYQQLLDSPSTNDEDKDPDKSQFIDLELQPHLDKVYGDKSRIVEDSAQGVTIHERNMDILRNMRQEDIMAARQELLNSISADTLNFYVKKRQAQTEGDRTSKRANTLEESFSHLSKNDESPIEKVPTPAQNLLQLSDDKKWLHFDVVETDKLEWMRDIPAMEKKLKPGEKFEARFDWNGVLLPYSLENLNKSDESKETETVTDDRELYLHGAEPNRPGYTLQELFRLARSNVRQQRISAFGAMAGLLNIYNQGFYDQVLEVPISKIFFLLRFGFDDSQPAQLEIVSKALSFLFYNESDETLLDSMFDNDHCQWHPTMPVISSIDNIDDPTSVENLQKLMKQMELNSNKTTTPLSLNVEENEEDSKVTMTDFQLAETDLIECLVRTNIINRIRFILRSLKPNNSTVTYCLKILIRLARTSFQIAEKIAKDTELMDTLESSFLPSLRSIDAEETNPPFYNYPQYLCLKLLRILITHNVSLSHELRNKIVTVYLQQYLYTSENIRTKLIQVQIECLRILRCLLLQKYVDSKLFLEFCPALRQMLNWHYNHNIYEVGGVPSLIRQHAASVLMAITASDENVGRNVEVQQSLGEQINDCCCSWLYRATRSGGIKEYSQATLLAAALNTIHWTRQNHTDDIHLRNCIKRYLPEFIRSTGFIDLINNLSNASILLRTSNDRRNVHPPLPNVGAVLMNQLGPQLIITQTYSINLLSAILKLLKLQLEAGENTLLEAIQNPKILLPLADYLKKMKTDLNQYLATNFFARCELQFVFQLITWNIFSSYITEEDFIQLVYKYLCCLPATNGNEIKQIFDTIIFSTDYMKVEQETLHRWRETCMVIIRRHITMGHQYYQLTMPFTQAPLLAKDWPYFHLTNIIKNYVASAKMERTSNFSEQEVIRMTFSFVGHLEHCGIDICDPTEQLMYLMIAFMGPDSQFLDAAMQQLLRTTVCNFYNRYREHTFDFEAVYPDKCKFENLYALFVDHFQAASYGDELFSSLVLVPLAQKYDNKWRKRLWSEYAHALTFLNCDESLLMGGITRYLDPIETDPTLIKAYKLAIITNLVRPGTIPYKIAETHSQCLMAFKPEIDQLING